MIFVCSFDVSKLCEADGFCFSLVCPFIIIPCVCEPTGLTNILVIVLLHPVPIISCGTTSKQPYNFDVLNQDCLPSDVSMLFTLCVLYHNTLYRMYRPQ